MIILTYILALLIGVILGLTGGGGSILTVPILVYVIGLQPTIAIGYSLFIVGITALTGAINYAIKKLISFKAAIIFAIPSFTAVFCVRKWIVPHIPNEIFHFSNYTLTKDVALMVIFATLMLIISISMIRNKTKKDADETLSFNFHYYLIGSQGLAIGVITGLLGAGGGFIIVPALVILANVPIRLAIGTSLLIIAINSLMGFVADLQINKNIDWQFLITFSAFAMVGVLSGGYLSKFISAKHLKIVFGYFLLAVGLFILLKEIFKN